MQLAQDDALRPFLAPNFFVDSDHAAVAAYAARHVPAAGTPRERMVALYYAVRDGFRYSPWGVVHDPAGFKASAVIARALTADATPVGHCIDKANVMAACARHVGVPSRLHFANVRNHVGTAELERQLGTDLLVFHGYVELWLDDRWVAATPAFNRALCERLGVEPLEFDGVHDSIFQPYDRVAGRFMEYVTDHGSFAGIPWEQMLAAWRRHYPTFGATGVWPRPGTSAADAVDAPTVAQSSQERA